MSPEEIREMGQFFVDMMDNLQPNAVVLKLGLDKGKILSTSGNVPTNVWHSIIQQAKRENKLDSLKVIWKQNKG